MPGMDTTREICSRWYCKTTDWQTESLHKHQLTACDWLKFTHYTMWVWQFVMRSIWLAVDVCQSLVFNLTMFLCFAMQIHLRNICRNLLPNTQNRMKLIAELTMTIVSAIALKISHGRVHFPILLDCNPVACKITSCVAPNSWHKKNTVVIAKTTAVRR